MTAAGVMISGSMLGEQQYILFMLNPIVIVKIFRGGVCMVMQTVCFLEAEY